MVPFYFVNIVKFTAETATCAAIWRWEMCVGSRKSGTNKVHIQTHEISFYVGGGHSIEYEKKIYVYGYEFEEINSGFWLLVLFFIFF